MILIIGVSGAKVHIGAAELKGMALATIVGVALSLIFKLISVLRPEEVVLDAADAADGRRGKTLILLPGGDPARFSHGRLRDKLSAFFCQSMMRSI